MFFSTDLLEVYHNTSEKLQKYASDFEEKDSGWILVAVNYLLEVRTNKHNPLKASSFIPLPEKIRGKKHTEIHSDHQSCASVTKDFVVNMRER